MISPEVLKEIIEEERDQASIGIARLLEMEIAKIKNAYWGHDAKSRDMPCWHAADEVLDTVRRWRESLEARAPA